MEGDEDFGVPAGWYPDPLGLPQLRWWDGQAWTEFTSEAQAPAMAQQAAAVAEPLVVAGTVGAAAASFVAETVVSHSVASEAVAAAPFAAQPLPEEPEVNVHNLGQQMQFLTRRERREYERRLEAEAALFPHGAAASTAQAAPAYIQQPVIPQPVAQQPVAQEAVAPAVHEPASPFVWPPGAAEEPQPQPKPVQQEPAFAMPFVDEPLGATSFADLIAGGGPSPESAVAPVAATGAVLVPEPPAPFVAPGLRELEPGLTEMLQDAALAPRAASSHANALATGSDPEERVAVAPPTAAGSGTRKRTYTVVSWVLAFSTLIQVAAAYLVVDVLADATNRPVMAVIWFGGLLVAAGLAGTDHARLKSMGHTYPASGWWALLTPLAYLAVRWSRTRTETARGGLLVVVWLVSTIVAAAFVYIQPELFLAAIR